MKNFFEGLRSVAVAGFLFLLPLYIVLIVVMKAWTSLSTVGARLAGMFGVNSVMGVGGSTVLSGLLLIVIWLGCGLLVRIRFVDAFSKAVERKLSKNIPGYATYKAMAEQKLVKVQAPSYRCALIRLSEYWQPAFVIEEDGEGNCIVFLPGAPDTDKGSVLLAGREQVRFVSGITSSQLDASLKKMGKGLLNDCGIQPT